MQKSFFFRFVILGVAFLVVMFLPSFVYGQGQSESHRRIPFTVFSDETMLKNRFGVRHEFPGKFTANLTLAEAHDLNTQGVKAERVLLYQLSAPPGACSPWPQCKEGGDDPETRTAYPDNQIPWGIATIYNDVNITATSGGLGVNVAVLDSGVDDDHLDLKNRIQQCVDFTGGPPGRERVREGSCDDKDGHGTHVAGTILADAGSDGLGIYGIAPEASLFAYRVCGNNGCWTDDIASAIDYAGDNEAHIVSLSLGGNSESPLIKEAIERNLHLLFVAAAGNDGPDVGSIDYPAANPDVIAVGAIDENLIVPDWSSRGINNNDYVIEECEVEFGAPGVSVESTSKKQGYEYLSGTSMATPHVSGLAAKVWNGSAEETRAFLQFIVMDIGDSGDDEATGFGLPQVDE